MADESLSARQQIKDALEELDRREQEFEAQMREAEENFASEMTRGRRDFAESIAQARSELHKALRDWG